MIAQTQPRVPPERLVLCHDIAELCGSVALASGLVVLAGSLLGVPALTAISPHLEPMSPATALNCVAGGISLILVMRPAGSRRMRLAGRLLGGLLAAVVLLRCGAFLVGTRPIAVLRALDLGGAPVPPNTALSFLLVGAALLLSDARQRRLRALATLCAWLAVLIPLVAVTGHAYGVRAFYNVPANLPMAFFTALALLTLCVGVVFARPELAPMSIVVGDSAGGLMARRVLPPVIFAPFLLGWLRLEGEREGLYSKEFGVSLLVVASVAIFLAVIFWAARGLLRLDLSRAKAEQMLRESEEKARLVLESSHDAFVEMDEQGRITGWNQRAEELFGWKREEAIGRNVADTIIPEPQRGAHRKGLEHFLDKGEGSILHERIEINAVDRTGREFPVELIVGPMHLGGRLFFSAFIHDISERKENEWLVHQQYRLLDEAMRAERRAHYDLKKAQAHLVQTEKLASLGQMVAGVAHEINNPLSFVLNNAAVLQRDMGAIVNLLRQSIDALSRLATTVDGQASEEWNRVRTVAERIDLEYTQNNVQDVLARSREGLRRIQQIVKDLRDFARLDEADLHEVDLNAGVASTINIVRGQSRKKGVEIIFDKGDLPPVTCFPAKINQVVMNLISNAVDASLPGQEVRVTTAREGEQDVRLVVEDRGHGIPAEIRHRIFDPFFTTKPPGEGTGLGLSIAYGIVQEHNGTIEVDAGMDGGARFTVRLPIAGPGRLRETMQAGAA